MFTDGIYFGKKNEVPTAALHIPVNLRPFVKMLWLNILFFHSSFDSNGHLEVQPQKHYGITSAISWAGPKDIDHLYTQKLIEALKPFGVFEDDEELSHRLVILGFLSFSLRRYSQLIVMIYH